MKKRIVIFASGTGSNAENIIRYFKNSPLAEVVLVISNRKQAPVLDKAKDLNVEAIHIPAKEIESEKTLKILKETNPDLIVLAGFLLKFPETILKDFHNKVINIHPALLPKFGGKGMYGNFVHQAVLDAKEMETGISIHYVNEHYDEGEIIFQKSFPVSETDTLETIVERIHKLEHEWFPRIIEELLTNA